MQPTDKRGEPWEGYKMSCDYEKLWGFAMSGLCILVRYWFLGSWDTEICMKGHYSEFPYLSFGTGEVAPYEYMKNSDRLMRGDKDYFVSMCEKHSVQFIEPNGLGEDVE